MKSRRGSGQARMRAEYNFDYSTAERGRYSKRLLKDANVSELERARSLGLVGSVKGGPRDVAERHSQYLKGARRKK